MSDEIEQMKPRGGWVIPAGILMAVPGMCIFGPAAVLVMGAATVVAWRLARGGRVKDWVVTVILVGGAVGSVAGGMLMAEWAADQERARFDQAFEKGVDRLREKMMRESRKRTEESGQP